MLAVRDVILITRLVSSSESMSNISYSICSQQYDTFCCNICITLCLPSVRGHAMKEISRTDKESSGGA